MPATELPQGSFTSEFNAKLASTPIQVLLKDKKDLVDLPADALLEDCLLLMAEKKINSIPIYKQTQHGSKSYLGILSISDILTKTVFL
jgi:CBS domain-containing protein